jgi:hypothetical protein
MLAGAVKGAIQGMKRKIERVIGGEDDGATNEKKRVKFGAKEVTNRLKKTVTSSSAAPAVAMPDPKVAQANKDQRAKRAAERLAREQAEREADEADDEVVVEDLKPKRGERRRSTSVSLHVSDIPRSTSKKSASPAKRMSSVKKRVAGMADTAKAIMSSTPAAAPRTISQTPLLKPSGSSSTSAGPKSMRQSRLSFGPTNFGFNVSPKKRAITNGEDEDAGEDASAGPVIPKRKSSLKADTSRARPTTAQSIARGVSKAAAAAKVGFQGDKAIRKTIRAVSGAE